MKGEKSTIMLSSFRHKFTSSGLHYAREVHIQSQVTQTMITAGRFADSIYPSTRMNRKTEKGEEGSQSLRCEVLNITYQTIWKNKQCKSICFDLVCYLRD